MKKPVSIALLIIILVFINTRESRAQLHTGMSDISVSINNVEWGLPFLQFTPIHPGIELGISCLEIDTEYLHHRAGLNAGYFYHNIIAHGIHAGLTYDLQWKFSPFLALDFGVGCGYLHAIYPGEGYNFDEAGHLVNQVYHAPFFQASTGLGLSFTAMDNFQPFIRYDMRMLQNIYNQVSVLKLGLRIPLK